MYSLSQYAHPRGQFVPSWEFAYCDHAERTAPLGRNLIGEDPVPPISIELLTPREAVDSFPRSRGKLSSWSLFEQKYAAKAGKVEKERRLHQALALTQYLEALYAAADAYPVEVLGPSQSAEDDSHRIYLELRADPERNALSKALKLQAPALRFDEVLRDDRRTDEWILTEAQRVGQREHSDTAWRFVKASRHPEGPPVYEFLGQQPPPMLRNPVLIPGDSVGRDIQFRRRLKALRALAEHNELLHMLVEPRDRILETHDVVKQDAAFQELDQSKQKAFEAIIGTLPLFLVQGPPGVGKTRLVRDLVCSEFKADSSGRILLTAQSNAAVDHLMDELRVGLEAEPGETLIVRCRPRDDTDEGGRMR